MKISTTLEPPKAPTTYLQIRDLPTELHKAAKHAAVDEGISLNRWLIEAIRKAVNANKEGK